jgi:uncharacterized protein (DUF2252 family)
VRRSDRMAPPAQPLRTRVAKGVAGDPQQSVALGRAARASAPRSSHAAWEPSADRPDPIEILERQAQTRVPELVPLRRGRMLASAFTFFRGSAAIMAADLAATPTSGLTVQLCGDAHLSNFGAFAAPDRSLVFSVNDFDETLPGPWEWDLKRLAASVAIAGRDRGFDARARRRTTLATARVYRETMRRFAAMGNLDVWYARLDVAGILERWGARATGAELRNLRKTVAKARSKDRHRALAKLTRRVDGELRIVSDPPLIVPIEELSAEHNGAGAADLERQLHDLLGAYRRTLQDDRRQLLDSYRRVHVARKVVGVGSVGTRAWIVLLLGRDERDPLFLQVKEAESSVLEPFAGAARSGSHGQRVVEGQRRMQAASDVFLGWLPSRGSTERTATSTSVSCGTRRARPRSSSCPRAVSRCTARCARGPWPAPTPARATASRSPPTSAAATCSTAQWATSPKPTPTRTSATSPPWSPASRRGT